MANGHIFYRQVFFSFHYVRLFGTKSDVMVAAGRYELVHISTDTTNTSRLPKGSPHIMKCILILLITGGASEPKRFLHYLSPNTFCHFFAGYWCEIGQNDEKKSSIEP